MSTQSLASSSTSSLSDSIVFAPDVQIITDATSSMGAFLDSLKVSAVQIASLLRVISPEARVGMRVYRDMCDNPVTEFIPQRSAAGLQEYNALVAFANQVRPMGGGDIPEAAKRGLYESLLAQEIGHGTIVLLYADAPPHHACNGANGVNGTREKTWFTEQGRDVQMWDWLKLARTYKAAGARVYSFISSRNDSPFNFYAVLSTITGGVCFRLPDHPSISLITDTTMHALLSVLGCGSTNLAACPASASALMFPQSVQTLILNPDVLRGEDDSRGILSEFPQQRPSPVSNLDVIPVGKVDLKLLPLRFRKDSAFRDVVFEVLTTLLTEAHVMSLTTNDVFGTLWRAVCCCRDDPRRDGLTDTMGRVSASRTLSEVNRQKLTDWLADSYNQSEEITELLVSTATEKGAFPALALSNSNPEVFSTAKELLEVARACDSGTMARITSLLTHLTVVHAPTIPTNATSDSSSSSSSASSSCSASSDVSTTNTNISTRLPLSLTDRDLFELLPHLMCPGTRFSLRPAIIIASLAYLADVTVLRVQAERFLRENKGKWFSKDQNENFSIGFVRLMNRLPAGLALTDEEGKLFMNLKLVSGFASNVQSSYTALTGYKPSHLASRVSDHRIPCHNCKALRSFTLMVRHPVDESHVICTTCFWKMDPCDTFEPTEDDRRQIAHDATEEHASHLTECRTCHTLYAVVRTEALHVEPKCYACRFDKGHGSRVTCVSCCNTFADPAKLFVDQSSIFTCGACAHMKKPAVIEHIATFQDIVATVTAETLANQLGIVWKTHDESVRRTVMIGQVRKPLTLSELLEVKATISATVSSVVDSESVATLTAVSGTSSSSSSSSPSSVLGSGLWSYAGKPMLNTKEVVQEMNTRIRSGDAQVETCYLCCEDLPCSAMAPSCGSCPTRSCTKCLTAWYGSLKPGMLVLPAHLACPFCKSAPKGSILAKYNREACGIRKSVTGDTSKLQVDYYHAWCTACYRVKPLVQRNCTDGEMPQTSNFECSECREERIVKQTEDAMLDPMLMGKQCPCCGSHTSKTSGCNHITCPEPCNAHWCYECGEQSTEDTIYEHMREEHGGMGYDWE